MACNNATPVYWLGVSFDSALEFYSDIALTTLAPDGWYSVGGTYREISGGILGPPQPCPSCLVPCGTGIVGQGGCGQYRLDMDLGNSTGAVIIVFDPYGYPDRCTWTYDGVSASEYSSAMAGYLEGFVGTQADGVNQCAPDLINISGSMNPPPGTYTTCQGGFNPLTIYNYIGGTFVDMGVPITLGPYAPADLSLTVNQPGPCMMVVPKPNITPTNLNLSVDGPCGSTGWNVIVNCPIDLNRFNCRVSSPGVVCGDPLTDELFTAHVGNITGISAAIGHGDWVFEDVNGVTPKNTSTIDKIFLVDNNGSLDCITVSPDSIVTAITPCSGSC